ncbi:hypothetical protein PINS_up012678 [Pythium insidiosum]|nr:hypothetical protein PINS_up012678 [Pythium insidiosum]
MMASSTVDMDTTPDDGGAMGSLPSPSPFPSPAPSTPSPALRSRGTRPPVTPNSARAAAQEERLLRRGRVIAAEFSQRRNKRYEFKVLPGSGHRTPSNSSPVESSPARYSPDQVAEAVMSFADFLHFLEQEEKQREHPLMPVIIERFAELGAVIESQKRHIDHWKQKELDLAISEAQQNLDLFREFGSKMEKMELELASATVDKQSWEEKYHKSVQEANETIHKAEEQLRRMNAQIAELQYKNMDLENMAKAQEEATQKLEQDNLQLRKALEDAAKDQATSTNEYRRLLEECERQQEVMRAMDQQHRELQRAAADERRRGDDVMSAAHTWEMKYQEEKRLREHLEHEVAASRKEREDQVQQMSILVGESGKQRADVEVTLAKYEGQVNALREKLEASERERVDLSQKLAVESDRVNQQVKEMQALRKQADAGLTAMKRDMEEAFSTRVTQLRDELTEESRRIRDEHSELIRRYESLQELNLQKSSQIAELIATRQDDESSGRNRIQELATALGEWQSRYEHLQEDIREAEKRHAIELKRQGEEMESQFNDHLQKVESFLEGKAQETESLRVALKAKEDELLQTQQSAMQEITRLQQECRDLQEKLAAAVADRPALRHEVEQLRQERDIRDSEIQSLRAQLSAHAGTENVRGEQIGALNQERLRLEELNRDLRQQLDQVRLEVDASLQQLSECRVQSAELESAHRATIVSLHHEKDDLQRALNELSAEKAALETQVQSVLEEKDILNESLDQYQEQVGEMEERGRQLLDAMDQVEREKSELQQAISQLQTQSQAQSNLAEKAKGVEKALTEAHRKIEELQSTISREELKCRDLQSRFEQAENERVSSQQRLHEVEKHARDLEAILSRLTAEATEQLNARVNASAAEYQTLVENIIGQLRHCETQLNEARQQASVHYQSSQIAQEQVTKLQRELDQRDVSLTSLKKELEAQVEAERKAQGQVMQLNKDVAAESDRSARLSEELATLRHCVGDREIIVEKCRVLSERCESLEAKLSRVAIDKDEEVRQAHSTHRSHVEELQRELTKLKHENSAALSELEEIRQQREALRASIEHSASELKSTRNALAVANDQIESLQEYSSRLEKQITGYEDRHVEVTRALNECKALSAQALDDKNHEVEQLQRRNEALTSQVRDAGAQSSKLYEAERAITTLESQLESKERLLQEAQRRSEALVIEVRSLRDRVEELQADKISSQTARERMLHEDIEDRERQLRTMQREKDDLRSKLSTATDEIGSMRREVHDRSSELEQARRTIDQLKLELKSRTDSVERELHQTQAALVSERDRGKKLKELLKKALDDAKRVVQDRDERISELEQESAKLLKQIDEGSRKTLTHSRVVEDHVRSQTQLLGKVKALQQRLDTSLRRETELEDQLADVKAEMDSLRDHIKLSLKSVEGIAAVEGGGSVLKDAVDLCALFRRANTDVNELREVVEQQKRELHELRKQVLEAGRVGNRDRIEREDELDAMRSKLSSLVIENAELRAQEECIDSKQDAVVSELRSQCLHQEKRIAALEHENEDLRKKTAVGTDHSHVKCKARIQRLMAELEEREIDISTMRLSQNTTGGSVPRRVRELEFQLKKKEEKIMMLNDHLTYLMTSTIQLQHDNEKLTLQISGNLVDGAVAP